MHQRIEVFGIARDLIARARANRLAPTSERMADSVQTEEFAQMMEQNIYDVAGVRVVRAAASSSSFRSITRISR